MPLARLHLDGLTVSYGDTLVLDQLEITVMGGELCAVVGASGVGKSTLLKCIAGLRPASAGIVSYRGAEPNITNPERGAAARNIGYVPQNNLLFPHLTVINNVSLPLSLAQGHGRDAAIQRALDILRQLKIETLANLYPWMLSGGEQQRVAIARAMALRPSIYLVDEPTSALDRRSYEFVGNLLRSDVEERNTIGIVVTHNLAFAWRFCHTVALLQDKQIKWHVPSSALSLENAMLEIG